MDNGGVLSGAARFFDQIITPLHILRAPIIAAIVAFLGLSVPAQTIEVYRALALDRYESPIQIGLALFTLLFSCFVIWYIARNFTLRLQAVATPSRTLGGVLLRLLPRLLGVLPLVGAGIGLLIAARGIDSVKTDNAVNIGDTVTIDQWLSGQMTQVFKQFADASLQFQGAQDFLNWSGYALCALAVAFIGMAYFRSRRKFYKYENPNRFLLGQAIPLLGFFVMLALVAAYCIFYYVSTDGATELAIQIGSIALFNIFIISLVFILGFLSFLHYQTKFPAIAVLVLLAVISTAFDLNDNHALRVIEADPAKQDKVSEALTSWLQSRPDRNFYQTAEFPYLEGNIGAGETMADEIMQRRAYPIYVIAAQGGGLYAAHQTALALARVQDRCPAFAQHIFAISGVSGGSLGAALFAALVDYHTRGQPAVTDPTCIDKPVDLNNPGWYEDKVNEFMSNDFISPIVAAGLFPDFLQRFIPFPINGFDRALAFEAGIERAWRKTVAKDTENTFKKNFYDLWSANRAVPALVLNTVEVQSGSRRLISPFRFKGQTLNSLETVLPTIKHPIRVSTAVGMSARFPWLLPAATWKSKEKQGGKVTDEKEENKQLRQFRFVDGGIYEYSGAATALEIAEFIKGHLGFVHRVYHKRIKNNKAIGAFWDANARVQLLVISDDEILEDASDPQEDAVRLQAIKDNKSVRKRTQTGGLRVRNDSNENVRQGFGELLSPVRSLLRSRTNRAVVWVTRAFQKFCPHCYKEREYKKKFPGFVGAVGLYRLNHTNYKLTLGWQLSKATRQIISAHSGFAHNCVAAKNTTYGRWPWAGTVFNHNNCSACRIEHDLQLSWLSTVGYLRQNVILGGPVVIAKPCKRGVEDHGLRNQFLPRLPPAQPASDVSVNPVP